MSQDNIDNSVPSRTQKRRNALAILSLAEQLAGLSSTQLNKLELPEPICNEINNIRRITSHIARKRQLAFLAKIMRRYDPEVFATAYAALGEDRERQRQENAQIHRLEKIRTQLIDDFNSDTALTELINQYPQIDRQYLRSLIRQARLEKNTVDKPPHAYRAIFQLLKELSNTEQQANKQAKED